MNFAIFLFTIMCFLVAAVNHLAALIHIALQGGLNFPIFA
jgi:hypothetical protein